MKTAPNSKATDTPQVNLILDAGLKGQKARTITPDTNRTDPIAGFALGSLSLLMFPKTIGCLWFECFTVVCAGIFTRSLLVAIAHPIVWISTGLVLLMAMLYLFTAMLNHPQCQLSALSKLILFTTGFLLSTLVIF